MKKRVLVVDDTPILTESIGEMLMMEGFEVSLAYNGRGGLAICRKSLPDLILTDLVMPEMGGFEFIQHIRNGNVTSSIPIIVLTADTNAENHAKASSAGANLILNKPFDEDFLIHSIRKLLAV